MDKRTFDVIPSPSDSRDFKISRAPLIATTSDDLPVNFTIHEATNLPVWDQADGGSCAAFTTAAAFSILLKQNFKIDLDPSRLFIYSQAKYFESQRYEDDNGLYMRDACGILRLYGTCKEATWPYKASLFSSKPNDQAMDEALYFSRKINYYLANPTVNVLKYILFDLKCPIIIGLNIYDSFEPDANYMVPVPNVTTDKLAGGHALLLVGFDELKKCFIARNSWGPGWGDRGHVFIPYDYVLDERFTFEHRYFQPSAEAQSFFDFRNNKPIDDSRYTIKSLISYTNFYKMLITIILIGLVVILVLYYTKWSSVHTTNLTNPNLI